MAFKKFPIRSFMKEFWAESYDCKIVAAQAKSSLCLKHRGEIILYATSGIESNGKQIRLQTFRQGHGFSQTITRWDRDEALASIITILYGWKEYQSKGILPVLADVFSRILKTIQSNQLDAYKSISPSFHLLLDAAEKEYYGVVSDLQQNVRNSLAESMKWLRDHTNLTEDGVIKLWRETIVKNVLED